MSAITAATKNQKLNQNEFRFVERLLYDYSTQDCCIAELVAELDELMDELLPYPKQTSMSATPGIVNTDGKASEPERWAIKREENLYGQHLKKRIEERRRHKAIVEAARATLNQQELDFCFLFYDQHKSVRACSNKLHYGQRRLYNIRQNVVYKVARFTGVL